MIFIAFLIVILIAMNIIFINLFSPGSINELWGLLYGNLTFQGFNIIIAIFWYLLHAIVFLITFKLLFEFLSNMLYFTVCRYNSIDRIFANIIKITTFVNAFYWLIAILITLLMSIVYKLSFIEPIKSIINVYVFNLFYTEAVSLLSVLPYLAYKKVDITFAFWAVVFGISPFTIKCSPVSDFDIKQYIAMLIIIVVSCFMIYYLLKKRIFFERIMDNEND